MSKVQKMALFFAVLFMNERESRCELLLESAWRKPEEVPLRNETLQMLSTIL
jgi:hypothetical protein